MEWTFKDKNEDKEAYHQEENKEDEDEDEEDLLSDDPDEAIHKTKSTKE